MSGPAPVGQAEAPAFLSYCAVHRFDHDESFLDEHSLSLFRPGPEEKAVVVRGLGGDRSGQPPP